MIKALKAIFNTPAQATKVADAVIKGTDAAWFTKEEQSEWFLRYLEATQPMNLSRRILAVAIAAIWMLSAVVLLGLTVVGALFDINAASLAARAVLSYMESTVNTPFLAVTTLYFAKGIAGGFKK